MSAIRRRGRRRRGGLRRPGDAAARSRARSAAAAAVRAGRLEHASAAADAAVAGRLSAARTGRLVQTGTESASAGTVAEAAYPIPFQGRVGDVIVYSSQVADIVSNVCDRPPRDPRRRRDRAAARAGRRLSRRRVRWRCASSGSSGPPSRSRRATSSTRSRSTRRDELGQLAVAFNDMQRQLAQLESARKKFIATASHELRTPIFSLGGFVELLEDEELDPETRRRFLDQVSRAGRAAAQAVGRPARPLAARGRLARAAPRAGRPRRADPVGVGRVRADARPARLRISSCGSPRADRGAVCDPVRVAQIMRILIDNALTHTPPGTRIVVTAARENGARPARRPRRRRGDRRRGDAPDLRAVLHGRRRAGVGARTRDRVRAGRADGGPADGATRRRATRCSRSRFPRERA